MTKFQWVPYPKYKDSGVEWLGEIPEHWEVKRLRFVAEINPSKIEVAQLDRRMEVSFLPMESIGEDGALQLDRARPIGEVESGYTYFCEGDVAIAKITPCFENGKGAIMHGLLGGIGFGTTELIVFRPKKEKTTSEYLNRVLQSSPFRKLGESEMYGAGGQKRIPDVFVRNFSIAFPPLKEQISIASFLYQETSRIDTLISEKERLISLLQEYRQALISHAVTKGLDPNVKMKDSGVEWLGEIPEGWEVKRLKNLAEKIGSGKTPLGGSEIYVSDGVLFLRSQNIYDNGLRLDDAVFISPEVDNSMENTRIHSGDILMNITGASIGRTCLVPKNFMPANVNQHVCIIRLLKSAQQAFVALVMKSHLIKSQIDLAQTGAAREGLNFDQVGNLVLAIPHEIVECKAIASFLDQETSRIDTLISEARKFIDLLKEYRSSLITAAVTGKIDVREVFHSGSKIREFAHE